MRSGSGSGSGIGCECGHGKGRVCSESEMLVRGGGRGEVVQAWVLVSMSVKEWRREVVRG
jgi:hypothetical protein